MARAAKAFFAATAWRKMDGLPPLDEVMALAVELAAALEMALGK